jgi:hypothetical protein
VKDVDAAPFDTLDALSAALARHEHGDGRAILQQLYARATRSGPRAETECGHIEPEPTQVERRSTGPRIDALRRELRLADEALYLLEQRARTANRIVEAALDDQRRFAEIGAPFMDLPLYDTPHAAPDPPGFRARAWVVAGLLAVSVAFGAGYAAVPLVRHAHRVTQPAAPQNEAATRTLQKM